MHSSSRNAVIVVSFNSETTISRCLSRLRHEWAEHVVVVDNGSSDKTLRVIAEEKLATHVIDNRTNRGYGAAVNQALAYLRAEGFEGDTVTLLDPDCFVDSATLAHLASVLATDRSAGAASPLLTAADGSHRVTAHEFRTLRSEFKRIWRPRSVDVMWESERPGLMCTDWVVGACLMVRWAAIDALGVSERYFLYAEDIDLCHRLRTRGYRVLVATDQRAVHLMGHSLGSAPFVRTAAVLKTLNELAFYEAMYGSARRRTIATLRLLRQVRAGRLRTAEARLMAGVAAGDLTKALGQRYLRTDAGEPLRRVLPSYWLDAASQIDGSSSPDRVRRLSDLKEGR
jgi:N-acetylglucosaminyl-diphospho-decaprenol L-rhamnosyltransferase